MTTPLSQYLTEHIDKDKPRLGATAELYLAKGFLEIAKQFNRTIVWSGGVAYNSLITTFMIENGVVTHKKVPPGDGGISFGQIAYALSETRM